jgi:hypothetical protein
MFMYFFKLFFVVKFPPKILHNVFTALGGSKLRNREFFTKINLFRKLNMNSVHIFQFRKTAIRFNLYFSVQPPENVHTIPQWLLNLVCYGFLP